MVPLVCLFCRGHDQCGAVVLVVAAAVGITLTAADHLFIMEPCLNPALERQVINRAYRIGQKRVLHVQRLVMANSVRVLRVSPEPWCL